MTLPITDVLGALAREWERMRAERHEAHPPCGEQICRYCGKAWAQWYNSRLDGHAMCVATPEFRQLTVDVLHRADCTYDMAAAALNVSCSTLRAWWASSTLRGRSTAGHAR